MRFLVFQETWRNNSQILCLSLMKWLSIRSECLQELMPWKKAEWASGHGRLQRMGCQRKVQPAAHARGSLPLSVFLLGLLWFIFILCIDIVSWVLTFPYPLFLRAIFSLDLDLDFLLHRVAPHSLGVAWNPFLLDWRAQILNTKMS